jgi:hypothetical protein
MPMRSRFMCAITARGRDVCVSEDCRPSCVQSDRRAKIPRKKMSVILRFGQKRALNTIAATFVYRTLSYERSRLKVFPMAEVALCGPS